MVIVIDWKNMLNSSGIMFKMVVIVVIVIGWIWFILELNIVL